MIESIINSIQALVTSYGAIGIFLGALIEEIISIIPSAAIIMFAGFFVMGGSEIGLASISKLLLSVSLPVALGLTIGSLLVYSLSYHFGAPFINKFGKYFGVSWNEIELLQGKLNSNKSDEILFFIARSTPIIPFTLINAFCGLVRWNITTYIVITFVGAFIRGTIVGAFGWQLGSLYYENAKILESLEKGIFVSIIIALVLYLFWRRKRANISD